MRAEEFSHFFVEELKDNRRLCSYYKYLSDKKYFSYLKSYFCQRLEFVEKQIKHRHSMILDCGCFYGTTALFLAMNGFSVLGSPLEFYFDEIELEMISS